MPRPILLQQEAPVGTNVQNAAREISSRLRGLEAEYLGTAKSAFSTLESLDPNTAKIAIEALGSRSNAALWFADRLGSLSGQTPWEVMAAGDLCQVHWVLNAIAHDPRA